MYFPLVAMSPNVFQCFPMFSNVFQCFPMFSNVFFMFSNVFQCSSPLLQCPLMSGMVHLPSGIFYHSITKISAFLRYLEMMMILSFYHQDAPYLTVFQMMMVKRLSLDLDNRFAAQNILSISKLLLWVESTFRKLRER